MFYIDVFTGEISRTPQDGVTVFGSVRNPLLAIISNNEVLEAYLSSGKPKEILAAARSLARVYRNRQKFNLPEVIYV